MKALNHKTRPMLIALCAVLLLAVPYKSWAQQTSSSAGSLAHQQADPTTLLKAAERVVLLIDQGLASELWAHTSEVTKQQESEFTQGVYSSRRSLGSVVNRRWSAMALIPHPGSEGTPAGLYMTISFATNFTGKSGVIESLTFREDEDGIWRIAGYAVR